MMADDTSDIVAPIESAKETEKDINGNVEKVDEELPVIQTRDSPSANPEDNDIPTSDAPGPQDDGTNENVTPSSTSAIQNKDYAIMKGIVDLLADAQDVDGNYITASFQRVVNKRLLPDYYHVIKFPTAFSTARAKIIKKQYHSWAEFVRDFALISHNAQVYNRPSAPVYEEANKLRELFQLEMAKLVNDGIVKAEDAVYPDLGPLPVAEDSPPPEPQTQQDESEKEEPEDEDDDEDEEDTDDDKPKKKGRKGMRLSLKRAGSKTKDEKDDKEDTEPNKVRGRPPKVHTPLEARINNVLKGLRKPKHTTGELKILPFERLPDKSVMPDYYQEIKNPMSLDTIKRNAKRKLYPTVQALLKDLDLTFENAKQYNEDASQVYKDAIDLQKESHTLVEQEINRPDSEFTDEFGRIPLTEIVHNGETWKVGDWAHLINPNDPTKPIISQIYRTWRDADGKLWINACWYYRPEQTVHRFDKMFHENEVVKTGRYLDHPVEDIVDRCFVMFHTRYFKGRPHNFPKNLEVYVCEARYNEEKFKFNRIKTWTSCLPDEIRDAVFDYTMDPHDPPRVFKKHPSPIKHLLQDDAKETDPLPKPTWGVPNAPPIVGAVHNAPRAANDSPPPEPTPSPPPPTPVAAPRQITQVTSERPYDNQGDVRMREATPTQTTTSMTVKPPRSPYIPARFDAPRASPTPVPPPTLQNQNSYGSQNGARSTSVQHHVQPSYNRTPSLPQQSYASQQATYSQQTAATTVPQQSYQSTMSLPPQPILPPTSQASYRPSLQANNSQAMSYIPPSGPVSVQPEVYVLPDNVTDMVAPQIRQKFHVDGQGRMLWFTAPPASCNVLPESTRKALKPSLKYLAAKLRKKERAREAGTNDSALVDGKTPEVNPPYTSAKRQKLVHEENTGAEMLQDITETYERIVAKKLAQETDAFYQRHWGTEWKVQKEHVEAKLAVEQAKARADNEFLARQKQKEKKSQHFEW